MNMVVLMIALTFLVFVAVDLLREHHRRADLVREGESLHNALEEEEPSWVAGFKVPQPLSYHPGHMWVHWVSPDQAYVGLDDFGRRLIGERAKFSLPWVGTHVGQGEESIRVGKNGEHIELLSPVGGEVVAVNPRLKKDPGLAFRDPYGRGWLMKIRSPRLYQDLSNLLSGSLARHWMTDTEERFRHRLMLASGSVIQDGGAPMEDIAAGLDKEVWRDLAKEFLALKTSVPK
jgi:glycine cleavage system H protein